MSLIAITGAIAAGKSTFTRALANATGAESIDTDRIARDLLASDPEVAAAVRAEFGSAALDPCGKVSRLALRRVVFGDSARRKALEVILHPRIRAVWQAAARERSASGAIVLVEIPLLYETGAETLFSRSIAVGCSPGRQLRRLVEDRGLSEPMAQRMIGSQLPLADKVRRSDCLIWNDGARAALGAQVALCARQLFTLRHLLFHD